MRKLIVAISVMALPLAACGSPEEAPPEPDPAPQMTEDPAPTPPEADPEVTETETGSEAVADDKAATE